MPRICCVALCCALCAVSAFADPEHGHLFDLPPRAPRVVPLLPKSVESGDSLETPLTPEIPETSEMPELPGIEAALVPGGAESEIPPPVFLDKEIMGKGEAGAGTLASFLLAVNDSIDPYFVEELALYYVEEAGAEGVNHDVAFAQMCLETGFLRYGGLVTAGMNNFCGLGSIGPGEPGESFPSPRLGVRAHIQHLKAYATDEPLERELVDPRRRWVRIGSAPAVKNLAGSWAADKQYSDKIGVILGRMYQFKDCPAEAER